MTHLDRAVNNDMLIVTKSLLPYLNIDRQKPVAIFIKAMELFYTISLFSNEASVRSMCRNGESDWEKSFLNDVKANLGNDKAYFIDAILKLTEAKDLLARSETPSNNDNPEYNLHPMDSGILESMPFPDQNASNQGSTSSTQPKASNSMQSPTPEQIINSLSSMLDPNQAQLLKTLSSLFAGNMKN